VEQKEIAEEGEERKCKLINSMWEVLGRRWALLILKNLNTKEAIRFNELKRLMPGISSTVLSDRLLELEREGLISKKIYPEIPPRVEYRLTAQARELGVILKELGKWAQRWKAPRITAGTV
jgi:DNA-binding HxlR family transcriptional regulator